MPRRKKATKKIIKKSSVRSMPAKNSRAKTTRSKNVRTSRTTRQSSYFQSFRSIKWTESYSSFLLGVVVIIVAVLFGVSIIRQQNQNSVKQTTSLSTGPTNGVVSPTPGTTVVENGKTVYVVKPNDSLSSIAQQVYGNGDKWVDIAKANNITSPSTIFTGDKLVLPNAPLPSELGQIMKPSPTPIPDAIKGNSYTVKRGDTLWDIAVRAYGDGYQWPKIAKANNLANPDLIFSGNIFTIPR